MLCSAGEKTVRVAAYCRVSTEKDDQRNSLEAQRTFFETYIAEHGDWTPAGVFADEAAIIGQRQGPYDQTCFMLSEWIKPHRSCNTLSRLFHLAIQKRFC